MINDARRYKKLAAWLLALGAVAGYGLLFSAAPAEAASGWFRLVPECATAKGSPGSPPPTPSLTCMLQTFGNIAQIILGLTGSAALIMFVYGGFLMVTSGGSSEAVSKGKTTLRNAIIGIFIVMTSGLLIQYGMQQIGIADTYSYIGQPCNNGAGVMVQTQDGKSVCAEGCSGSQLKGFSCMDTVCANGSCKKGDGRGKYCIPNLCKNDPRDVMCCYNPDANK